MSSRLRYCIFPPFILFTIGYLTYTFLTQNVILTVIITILLATWSIMYLLYICYILFDIIIGFDGF